MKHYAAAKRNGTFGGAACAIEDCDLASYTRGLCSKHYQRKAMRAAGVLARPEAGGPGAWYENASGYVVRKIPNLDTGKRRMEQQHRIVLEEHLGRKLVDKENVHHINGVRNDNRLENLELWSTKQPYGQRVTDKTAWAIEWLKQYDPDALSLAA